MTTQVGLRWVGKLLCSVLMLGLLAACGTGADDAISPAAEATIQYLQQENNRLSAELQVIQDAAQGDEGADLLGQMLAATSPLDPTLEAAAAATEPPTVAPTATPIPTPLPPPTPLPTFEPTPLGDEPPTDRHVPATRFLEAWQGNSELQQAVGWALETDASAVPVVTQTFERGLMLWRSDTTQIYAFWNDDSGQHWRAFEDTFQDGEPETDPSLAVPSGFLQPERGFGKLWRQNPDLRAALGWALARERRDEAQIQAFERGLMASLGAQVYGVGQTPEGETIWFQQ